MKLREIPKEELELMGYDDIAWYILNESGKKMKLNDIFKKVIQILSLPSEFLDSHLLDFFEQMSINKKFIMLENGYWDLQSRHKMDIEFEDIEEDDDYIELEDEEDMLDDEDEDIFYEKEDETEDVVEDDLSDLVVIEDEEEASL
ncbi:MAG: DNA-directed RNA polymerase subunit delta [Firmicutes bacterium]|nr:DNA-directed RNA polymerase subunit delta [Bacillota bacterium]